MWRVKDQYIDMMNNENDYWMSEWYDIKECIILDIVNILFEKKLFKYFDINQYLSSEDKIDYITNKLEWKTYEELTLIYKELKW